MEILPEARLLQALRAQNPWWSSGVLPRAARATQARPCDGRIRDATRAVLLVGPRGSGKTATLLRALDARLRSGPGARSTAYLPLDHPLLRLVSPGELVDLAIRQLGPAPLLLLDGLQALPDWPARFVELVKTRPQARIVGAASVRPEIEDESFETIPVPPLRFHEFCALRGVPDLGAPPLDLLAPELPRGADPADDYLFGRVLEPALADYLVRGGFPAAALEPDLAEAQRLLREGIVAPAVYQDLPAVEGIGKLPELERVFSAALVTSGAPLVLDAFAAALALDVQTTRRYLDHLRRALLLRELKNFAAASDRSRSLFLPADPGLPNALLERGAAVLLQPEERERLLLCAVVSHVAESAKARGYDVAYFREGDARADLVVVTDDGAVPIRIVDREEVTEADAAGVEKLQKRLQARTAFLLSRARPRRRETVTFFEAVLHLPAAYFLHALRS
ncbi:MAG: DUF4143 domain-containing protein [Planctomycetaceae bacterium]